MPHPEVTQVVKMPTKETKVNESAHNWRVDDKVNYVQTFTSTTFESCAYKSNLRILQILFCLI